VSNNYFTETEIDEVIALCAEKVKGHKRHAGRKKYTVFVDGGVFEIGRDRGLREFLALCIRPKNIRVFRNFDKGATIDLPIFQ
jgi:hypothetical protein